MLIETKMWYLNRHFMSNLKHTTASDSECFDKRQLNIAYFTKLICMVIL